MSDELVIRYVRLDALQADPRNARTHDLEAIKASIRRYGFRDPLDYDARTGWLAGGHGTTDALVELRQDPQENLPRYCKLDEDGEWMVPVVDGGASDDDLSASGFNVALNQTRRLGGWDPDALVLQLEDLHAAAPEMFDELRMGEELDEMLRRAGEVVDILGGEVDESPGRAEAAPPVGQEEDTPLEDLEPRPDREELEERPALLRCEACGHLNPTRV